MGEGAGASSWVSIQFPERDSSYTSNIQLLLQSWILSIAFVHLLTTRICPKQLEKSSVSFSSTHSEVDKKRDIQLLFIKKSHYWNI